MRVEWSDPARNDLRDIINYIARDSAFYAKTFGEKVVLATRRLKDFPKSGRKIPETEDKNLREILVQGYRIMYRHEPKRVLILGIMNGRRDLDNPGNQPWNDN